MCLNAAPRIVYGVATRPYTVMLITVDHFCFSLWSASGVGGLLTVSIKALGISRFVVEMLQVISEGRRSSEVVDIIDGAEGAYAGKILQSRPIHEIFTRFMNVHVIASVKPS